MKRHQAADLIEHRMQVSDIAVAHKDLGIGPDGLIVQILQDMGAAVSPSGTKNGLDLRVPEQAV